MNYRGYYDLRRVIRDNISLLQSRDFDLIVGIPRSGMIPAYMISNYLNKTCCDLQSFLNSVALKPVDTQNLIEPLDYQNKVKNILLVDDSIASGRSLEQSLQQISTNENYNITTLCIYSTKSSRSDVDLFFEYLPGISVFEWMIFHSFIVKGSCVSIDGVLCIAPTKEQIEDHEKYLDFLIHTPPLFLATGKIGCIVTNRLEKYRSETEAWLKKNGVDYNSLIMLKSPSSSKRKEELKAIHKANAYKKSRQNLFIESNREQAIKIHELTKFPVYCIETNKLYSQGILISAFYGHKYSREIFLNKLRTRIEKLPKPIYNFLRGIYRFVS
ncbi:phosphoribosyltransferase family protein [Bacillaceae bacterium IKA-2]|nr:phosphoribosyltransferase family protein [Bacillaceae bacterium IKA-2]